MIKNLDISIAKDEIDTWEPGVPFVPRLEVEDDDRESEIRIQVDDAEIMDANPTVPYSLRFTLYAEDAILDDALKVNGKGIRASYVDSVSVDNDEAQGRLQIYPFYQLEEPTGLRIDEAAGKAYWNEVDYAGAYEVIVSETKKNGDEKTTRRTVSKPEADVKSQLSQAADGRIGIAVRALPTEEEGYVSAVLSADNTIARWDSIAYADQYRLRITWLDNEGRKKKHEETVTGTSKDVRAYTNSASKHEVEVTVRAIPKRNDAKYFNIAISEFAMAGDLVPDTSDYEVEDIWEMLGEYQSVVDGNFAAVTYPDNYTGSPTTSFDGQWKRRTYRWQYLVDGIPFDGGWKQIGGTWYYFDEDGYMHTGWLEWEGNWYYFISQIGGQNGAMLTGSHEINGKSYEFDENGVCLNP